MAHRPGQLNILQALRAYAALPVVLFHTGFMITGIHKIGIFGVHMFFVLSGYLIASICATDPYAFLRRRIIRIVPSYWLMTLLLYCVAAQFPYLMSATQALPLELLKSLFFIPYMKSNGLFQPILFVGWTINYEICFYVVMALSVFLIKRRASLLATAILLSIMGVSSLFADKSGIARFYSDPIICEFILGLIVYYCVHAVPKALVLRLKYPLTAVMLVALFSLPLIEAFDLFPSLSLVIQFGPLSFLLIWSSCLLALSGNDLRYGILVLIGDASYTLYLVHPYIEMALDRIVAKYFPIFHIATVFGCLFAVAVAIAASIVLYLKVEKPTLSFLVKRFCKRDKTAPHSYKNATPYLATPPVVPTD
jgi:exopolysaccharide production protein ExoZ